MRLAAIALGALLVCLAGRVAWADDAAAARDHAQKATTFYKLAKYDDAIREFEAAYEAKADPALLYNIAQCHRLAGHDGEALRLYRNYLRDAPRGPYRSQAEEWIATLQKSAASPPPPATVSPPPAPPETPPAPVETTPASGPVTAPATDPFPPAPGPGVPPAPGSYPPAPTAPADSPAAQPAAPNPPPGPAPLPAQPAASRGHRTAGIVVASIGGAFVIGGAICGLIAKAEAKKVEDAAANHEAFDPTVEKAGRNAQTAQWIGYGIGAAGLAVGVILIATSPSTSAEAAPQNRVALAPLAGPGLGGALMRVTF